MGKLFCEPSAVTETLAPAPAPAPEPLQWPDPSPILPTSAAAAAWGAVRGLEEQQRRSLERISERGVLWRNPAEDSAAAAAAAAAAAPGRRSG
ncbi:hypothetical protein ACMD2_10482 [Ananas comosus]|uniref:Uncharacterized protein n=1 Tax=Ananas comosus TaxID=4615 RepID=A0A199VFA7_ANACO|nr:hypothetical protein ACMD2_10482 [Ananas comosus]